MKTAAFALLSALALVGCHRSRPVVGTPPAPAVDVTTELSRMGADAVLWQNTSAEAYWCYKQAYAHATQRLQDMVRRDERTAADTRPRAVIVDIDETVLDNSPYQVNAIRQGRTFKEEDWKEWTDKASAQASPGALDFLHQAEKLGCEVFYITNRSTAERSSTLKNLAQLGFPFADTDHLLLMEGTSDKTARRAQVAATHRIVLLVGDQLRDFDERFKDRSVNNGKDVVDAMADSLSRYFILLPNPMYGTYRDAVQGKGTDAEKMEHMREYFERNGY